VSRFLSTFEHSSVSGVEEVFIQRDELHSWKSAFPVQVGTFPVRGAPQTEGNRRSEARLLSSYENYSHRDFKKEKRHNSDTSCMIYV